MQRIKDEMSVLERVKQEGTPLIDGNQATFVWEGETAPFLHLESEHWNAVSLEETAPGIWTYTTELPVDAYLEYYYATEKRNPKKLVPDAFNKRTFDSGMGHFNHFFAMPGRIHTPLIERQTGITAGTVTKHIIDGETFTSAFGVDDAQRPIWLYKPPTEETVPLLVVYDGWDYQERGKIVEIVDNLIAQGSIRPIAMLMIRNAGAQRFNEYLVSESLLLTLTGYLLPLAKEHLNLLDPAEAPGAYGVLGASMGGLMALYTALRVPETFGNVIAQAGAFFHDRPGIQMLITQWVKMAPPAPLKIWQDVGTLDFLLSENQAMRDLLLERGYDVTYREHDDGHNYTAWRDQLPDALTTIFGT